MKIVRLLFLFVMSMVFFACEEKVQITSESNNALKISGSDNFKGILKLESRNELDDFLSQFNSLKFLDWEKQKGYQSLKSYIDNLYLEIDSISDEASLLNFVDKNSEYLGIKEEHGNKYIISVFGNTPYSHLANKDGFYIIGDCIYKVLKEYIIISNISNYNLLKNIKDNDIAGLDNKDISVHKYRDPGKKSITIGNMTAYYDPSGCNMDRCIVTNMGSETTIYRDIYGLIYYKTGVYLDIETWRKSILCYWYQYATIISYQNTSCHYNLYGDIGSLSLADYTSQSQENGYSDWWEIHDWGMSGDLGLYANFTQMHFETTHQGMNSIWCVFDYEE